MTIAEALKRFRTSRGLTLDAAAARIGRTKQYWYNYEKSINAPPAEIVVAIATAFGVSTDYLLGLTDDPTPHWTSQ